MTDSAQLFYITSAILHYNKRRIKESSEESRIKESSEERRIKESVMADPIHQMIPAVDSSSLFQPKLTLMRDNFVEVDTGPEDMSEHYGARPGVRNEGDDVSDWNDSSAGYSTPPSPRCSAGLMRHSTFALFGELERGVVGNNVERGEGEEKYYITTPQQSTGAGVATTRCQLIRKDSPPTLSPSLLPKDYTLRRSRSMRPLYSSSPDRESPCPCGNRRCALPSWCIRGDISPRCALRTSGVTETVYTHHQRNKYGGSGLRSAFGHFHSDVT